MDIGEETEVVTVEPLEEPGREPAPEPVEQPREPDVAPANLLTIGIARGEQVGRTYLSPRRMCEPVSDLQPKPRLFKVVTGQSGVSAHPFVSHRTRSGAQPVL